MDAVTNEVETTRNLFSLKEILAAQSKHDIQIIRGEDYQYVCYIDKKAYSIALTPMYALIQGLNKFNLIKNTKHNHLSNELDAIKMLPHSEYVKNFGKKVMF